MMPDRDPDEPPQVEPIERAVYADHERPPGEPETSCDAAETGSGETGENRELAIG